MSEYIDGSLELGEETQVERHLSECEVCQAIRDDLVQIVHFSRNLPDHDPGAGLWSRIQSEIAAERTGVISANVSSWWSKLRTGRLTLSFPQVAAATASILLVTLSIVLPKWTTLVRQTSSTPPVESQLVPIQPADDSPRIEDIMQRLGELKSDVELRKAGWNPEVRALFDRDVLYIDQTLAECHHALQDNPKDDVCREMMLNACREKMRLLEGFSDY